MTPPPVLAPGATLGVLGGGQLGRMFVHAAQRLGYRCIVLDPDPDSPAGRVAERHLRADYLDEQALDALAREAAAVTTEFENVPAQALRRLAERAPVAPGAAAVAVCQDRALEKTLFARCGVPCAPHALIDGDAALAAVPGPLLPGILKTAQLGYDGKGQRGVDDRAQLAAAWRALGGVRCVLEQRLALASEISVVLARTSGDEIVSYPPFRNLHRDGILAVTQWPAAIDAALARDADRAARALARALDYVGVLCVEFFVDQAGRLHANEMAPRPHNSGHCTIDAADVSQFDWQVRTLAGLPLAAPRVHSSALMLNLLGDLWRDGQPPDWTAVLAMPGARLQLYGKREARPGRKMGHLTLTAGSAEAAEALAREAARQLGLAPW
ncbi:MAG: 5-(carboxyamino)imidazole ribonucleotide synthase [Burkholderiaceae bacterium]|nr:5-(carboxyamino)imidazole ribonucleotide synthase [Ideonella sp.]MCC7286937.1 5-(carboxyamino)imidazole ribonucleotide synthase [Burkholderiaceae bacterium]